MTSLPVRRLTVVVPTRNEAPNIALLVERTIAALRGFEEDWEIIFVDDSDDTTPVVISDVAKCVPVPVRLLHRAAGERHGGLGGAVQAGFGIADGQVIAVMDADLQHPPEVLPALVSPLLEGSADVVAGSRYGSRGSTSGLDGGWRRFVSWACRWLTHRAVRASRPIDDPLSGLFAFKRGILDGVQLRPDGYKILLEVVARGSWDRAVNVEYAFSQRHAGNSKAGLREGLVFLRLLARLGAARRVPRRFASGTVLVGETALVSAEFEPRP